MSDKPKTKSLTVDLPILGAREDYLHALATALTAARNRGDENSALMLGALLTLADEAISFREGKVPHFFFPTWGRTA